MSILLHRKNLLNNSLQQLIELLYAIRQVSPAMFRGSGLFPEETKFPAVRDPGTAGRCTPQAFQRMGNDKPDFRGGFGAIRPRARSQYLGSL